MNKGQKKRLERKRIRIRSKLFGTPERPRLCFRKSNKFLYATIIDDLNRKILLECSTLNKEVMKSGKSAKNIECAKQLGKTVAEAAKQAGIQRVVFDRGFYIYHGKVKALADAVREGGIQF